MELMVISLHSNDELEKYMLTFLIFPDHRFGYFQQQLRYDQNEVSSFLLPSSTHLPLISNPRPTLITTSATHRTKTKPSHAVPLPPLTTNPRIIRIRARGIRLNTGEQDSWISYCLFLDYSAINPSIDDILAEEIFCLSFML